MPTNSHLHPSTKVVTTELIDPKTGHIISRTVETPLVGARRNGAASKRQEMIERITAMVQGLEIQYHFGNNVVECLKNYKRNPRVKKVKQKYFIADKDRIIMQYEAKHGTDKTTPDVLEKEIGVLREIIQRINEFELLEHWKNKLNERFEILNNLKKFNDRKNKEKMK